MTVNNDFFKCLMGSSGSNLPPKYNYKLWKQQKTQQKENLKSGKKVSWLGIIDWKNSTTAGHHVSLNPQEEGDPDLTFPNPQPNNGRQLEKSQLSPGDPLTTSCNPRSTIKSN